MRRLSAIVTLILLPAGAAAADPVPNVKETISRGLTFLAKDNLAWKEKRQCAECHHAPFTIWALNEGKKQGYAVDEQALADRIRVLAGHRDPGDEAAHPAATGSGEKSAAEHGGPGFPWRGARGGAPGGGVPGGA